ncbi:MAG: bifunctional UDP-N-acetylglucosamine diphosphorylase/glucosamine-1-phosphate N-acetyltransferase GlmU [Peptococcaceae bacterium]|nr:bifunctional UDP-N-acetylglucosamine diphosphorylase/glucosamine-1-phosphate N-acetyltransferase GlmU [Peptococcaceae bacterium]
MSLAAVVLAAGKGTRMKSRLPKVLHQLCGRPMISHVLDAVRGAGAGRIVVVVGHGADQVSRVIGEGASIALQAEQLGTGHALLQAGPFLDHFKGSVLVVCGDTPLITSSTLAGLAAEHVSSGAAATVLTAIVDEPHGYGRVIRDGEGRVIRIVEEKDAGPEEKLVREINTGIYCFAANGLFEALAGLRPANAQGEYYLTDIIGRYVEKGLPVRAATAGDPEEVSGINDRVQLARAERLMREAILEDLMRSGVTVVDPASTFIDRRVKIAPDTVIYPFTIIEGDSIIGEGCVIGPGTRLKDARVGESVTIQNSIVLESTVGNGAAIGPFAYLRPGTVIGKDVKVGDFVEIKKSFIGDGSKVPHLSYLGDAVVGRKVNIGAGTITCNYDGQRKWPTEIGDGAFIGSNANLVAPVKIGPGAYVGAGSTITKDIPGGALGVERARQTVVADWAKKKKGGRHE